MQILKSKKDRIPEYSQFVDSRPDLPTINLDEITNKSEIYRKKTTDFIEEGKTATERYNEFLSYKVEEIIARYPAHFAIEGQFANLAIRVDNLIAWNREALDIFIHADYPATFNKFKREMDKKILEWAKVDCSSIDGKEWKEQVDKALTEFAFQYLNNRIN